MEPTYLLLHRSRRGAVLICTRNSLVPLLTYKSKAPVWEAVQGPHTWVLPTKSIHMKDIILSFRMGVIETSNGTPDPPHPRSLCWPHVVLLVPVVITKKTWNTAKRSISQTKKWLAQKIFTSIRISGKQKTANYAK